MPTLILEKRVDTAVCDDPSLRAPVTVEAQLDSASVDLSSKTPKRTDSAAPQQRKVTPGTTSSTKQKLSKEAVNKVALVTRPATKQKSLLSFFTKAADQPARQPTIRRTTPACVTATKTLKSAVDLESLRDIVTGSMPSPVPGCIPTNADTPENYNLHKGSPMPTNLKQPTFGSLSSFSSPRERLLDRLNQQDVSQVQPLPRDNDDPATSPQCDRWSAIEVHNDEVHNDDDGENTVCFSQESQQSIGMDVEQPSSSDDAPEASNVHVVVQETTNQAIVQEVIVDMTQMDTTQSNLDEVLVEEEADDDDRTLHVKECIVDLTQMDSGDDRPVQTKTGESEVTVAREQDAIKISTENSTFESYEGSAEAAATLKTTRKRKVVPSKPEPDVLVVEKTKKPERLAMLDKNEALRQKTLKGSAVLVERVAKGLEEEIFDMPSPTSIKAEAFENELTRQAVVKLAVIVQGRCVFSLNNLYCVTDSHSVFLMLLQ